MPDPIRDIFRDMPVVDVPGRPEGMLAFMRSDVPHKYRPMVDDWVESQGGQVVQEPLSVDRALVLLAAQSAVRGDLLGELVLGHRPLSPAGTDSTAGEALRCGSALQALSEDSRPARPA